MLTSIFRGRPYGRLLRQLDDARHTLITETAKAEQAQAKADLAKAQIQRLEAWIKEQDDAHAQREHARMTRPVHGYNPKPEGPPNVTMSPLMAHEYRTA